MPTTACKELLSPLVRRLSVPRRQRRPPSRKRCQAAAQPGASNSQTAGTGEPCPFERLLAPAAKLAVTRPSSLTPTCASGSASRRFSRTTSPTSFSLAASAAFISAISSCGRKVFRTEGGWQGPAVWPSALPARGCHSHACPLLHRSAGGAAAWPAAGPTLSALMRSRLECVTCGQVGRGPGVRPWLLAAQTHGARRRRLFHHQGRGRAGCGSWRSMGSRLPRPGPHLAVVGAHVLEGRLVARHQVGDVRVLALLQIGQVCGFVDVGGAELSRWGWGGGSGGWGVEFVGLGWGGCGRHHDGTQFAQCAGRCSQPLPAPTLNLCCVRQTCNNCMCWSAPWPAPCDAREHNNQCRRQTAPPAPPRPSSPRPPAA